MKFCLSRLLKPKFGTFILQLIGFFAYLFWYLAGYSVVRDVFRLVSY